MVPAAPPPTKESTQPRGGGQGVRVRSEAHLPALSLKDGGNLCSILAGTVLLALHGAVLCKNWRLCGLFWEYCKRKRSHIPTPQEVATTFSGLLNAAWECSTKKCDNLLVETGIICHFRGIILCDANRSNNSIKKN